MPPTLIAHPSRVLTCLLLIILCMPLATLHAQDGDAPPVDPRQAVAAVYFTALLTQNFDFAQPLMCAADRALIPTPDDLPDLWENMGLDADLDDITVTLDDAMFMPVQADDDWAQINVSGALLLGLPDADEPQTVTVSLLSVVTLWAIKEDGVWRGCLHPPPDVAPIPGPAEVTREYLAAVYSADFDRMLETLCAAQRETASQAAFAMAYGQVVADGLALDFTPTILTVAAWDAGHAEVTLGGTIQLTFTDRPGGTMIAAQDLSPRPFPLVYEDGWKICQVAEEHVEP